MEKKSLLAAVLFFLLLLLVLLLLPAPLRLICLQLPRRQQQERHLFNICMYVCTFTFRKVSNRATENNTPPYLAARPQDQQQQQEQELLLAPPSIPRHPLQSYPWALWTDGMYVFMYVCLNVYA